jgi:spermidine synthase
MLRDRIKAHYGEDCQILTVRRAARPGSSFFVVDFSQGARLVRLMGAVGRNGLITEQSAMDLLHPERLVFGYERLMLVAFALVPRPRSALLLGLGGGAMYRHLAAYLPDCAVTVVERDPVVIELAQRYFHITQPVVCADAEQWAADAREEHDAVLVDLYDGQGATATEPRFWTDCVAMLRPGGCLAVNWADFVAVDQAEGEARTIATVAAPSAFLAERVPRPNIVQLASMDPEFRLVDLPARFERFAQARKLPREDAVMLRKCRILSAYPTGGK